jgi:hypothetical protein
MTEVTTTVRPRAQYLRQMPTLARLTPEQAPPRLSELARSKDISFVLELKLETPGARYWLCTQGLPEASPGVPKSFVVEYITPEYPRPNGTWQLDDAAAYGPQNTTWLQGNDYLHMLSDEFERLQHLHEEEHNWRTAQQMEVTQEEMRQVVAQMDAIVQKRQGQKANG